MVAGPKTFFTKQEYAALENAAEHKSEYINGQIYAMSGGSRDHARIGGDAFASLHAQLRNKACEPLNCDMRIDVLDTGATFYPDVSVACPPLELAPDDEYALTNPVVLIEVLSPSTETNDRISKWSHYQRIPSLRDYVLVAQDKIRIEHYARRDDNSWILHIVENIDGFITLDSIECRLNIAEVYERVTFPAAKNELHPGAIDHANL